MRALRVHRRLFSSKPALPGFFELRTDVVKPKHISSYLDEVERTAADRRRIMPGWKGIWKTEIGGDASTVRHLYHWTDYDDRDRCRELASDDATHFGNVSNVETQAGMTLPLPSLRENLSSTHSMVMVEASRQGALVMLFWPAIASEYMTTRCGLTM